MTFSNPQEDDIVWLMCTCYVWPTYRWSTWGYQAERQGKCARCDSFCHKLSDAIETKEQAIDVFVANYGHEPKPITS
jgi:hypothetical protein